MTDPNRIPALLALLQQAEGERDAARAGMQRADEAARRARSQLDQLLTYRRDYEQRWTREFTQRSSIEIVRYYQGFMQRLTQAIEQQQHAAVHAGDQAQAARDALRERELRVASIRKLIERRERELQLAAARREQRGIDELAALAAWHQRDGAAARAVRH